MPLTSASVAIVSFLAIREFGNFCRKSFVLLVGSPHNYMVIGKATIWQTTSLKSPLKRTRLLQVIDGPSALDTSAAGWDRAAHLKVMHVRMQTSMIAKVMVVMIGLL